MAVELRCPECKAKLRLPQAPEPDSEIECPKCGSVFPTDDNIVHAGDAEDGDPAAKSKSDGDKKAAGEAEKSKTPAAQKPFKRKKRRAKKKKTNPVLLWGVIGSAVLIFGFASAVLLWFMLRTTPTQEMMSYLPDECDEVCGFSFGHLTKYVEFNKSCENIYNPKGFKKAADMLCEATGVNFAGLVDYIMQGEGRTGGTPGGQPVGSTVIRTKIEFDPGVLKKFPGAQEGTMSGVKYYAISDIPELGYPSLRVFAPSNRIVVFCPGNLPEGKFKSLITGNKESADGGIFKRAGPLIKQVTRGTVWKFVIYGKSVQKPTPPAPKTGQNGAMLESDDDNMKKEIVDLLNSCQGMGYKASVGSRDVRFEWVIWYKDSDAASELVKKWKDKDWIKDDEKNPPRWWGTLASRSGGGKTAANSLRDNLGFRSSGETFSVRTALETKVFQNGMSTMIQSVTQSQGGGGEPSAPSGPGGGGGGPGPPGGGPKLPGPKTPGGPGPGGKPRRRSTRFGRVVTASGNRS
jgi:hypothetical protein